MTPADITMAIMAALILVLVGALLWRQGRL